MGDMNYNPYENPDNKNKAPGQNYGPNINPNHFSPYPHSFNPRGNMMESVATSLGTTSIILSSCLYVSIPCGALAILFALLSRGEKMTLSAQARNGLLLGITGIVVTVAFYAYALYTGIQDAGSLENLLRETCETMGYDFETLFGEYFQ